MLKTFLVTCAVAVAALCAPSLAYAQSDTPGEGRAATSKSATKAEKEAAKKKRRSTSKEIAHGKGSASGDNRTTSGPSTKSYTAEEKAAAKAKRQAEGKAATAEGSGRLEDTKK